MSVTEIRYGDTRSQQMFHVWGKAKVFPGGLNPAAELDRVKHQVDQDAMAVRALLRVVSMDATSVRFFLPTWNHEVNVDRQNIPLAIQAILQEGKRVHALANVARDPLNPVFSEWENR